MDTDKAYLLGLVIGGGMFGNSDTVFTICLPYKKWGSVQDNPDRAGKIAEDIVQRVNKMFGAVYDISVYYDTSSKNIWKIVCSGDIGKLKLDLAKYGIPCNGELRGNVDIHRLIEDLSNANLKRRFIAGLADTIGSMARSQRRFTDEHQIISFEIKGFNFKFVCDLCRLLYSINCIPDQVNWNHPNIHCTSDPYYKGWAKGFKLRILLDQYANFGAFAFKTKAETSVSNLSLQQETHVAQECEMRDIHVGPSTIHPGENDPRLPKEIRGGHYLHFRHFCAAMGCEHAPYCKIEELFDHVGELVVPFPILHKDELTNIEQIIRSDKLLSEREYSIASVGVSSFLKWFEGDPNKLIYGNSEYNGYPVNEILQAVAYVIADDDELFGNRPKGYYDIVKKHLDSNPGLCVEVRRPDLLTPLVITGNGRGAMLAAKNPNVYKRLVEIDTDNKYKLLVRKITEEDLRDGL